MESGQFSVTAFAEHWLRFDAIPLWLDRGVDRAKGGFFDALDHQKMQNVADFKRLRVLARQLYVFCEGSKLGVAGSKEVVMHGLDFLLEKARLPSGAYASRFTLGGEAIDTPIDLYDLAFVLFALAHCYGLLKDAVLADEAHNLLRFIYRHMRHTAGGFLEGIPTTLPRRQNPHMHLLEAALAWCRVRPDEEFVALADEMMALFKYNFFRRREGVLAEYFDEVWELAQGQRGQIIEPGHHFEWVWLLSLNAMLRRQPIDNRAIALKRFALRYGIDQQTGFLFGELSAGGYVVQPSCRLWPHAEWVRAELATVGSATASNLNVACRQLYCFLDCGVPGLWFERWDPGSQDFIREPSPASSLYHIVAALTELIGARKALSGEKRIVG